MTTVRQIPLSALAVEKLQEEVTLRERVKRNPGNVEDVFALADLWCRQGRYSAVAELVCEAYRCHPGDSELAVRCASYLSERQRERESLALCEQALAAGATDARLYAIAGRTALALGEFELARERLLGALERGFDDLGSAALSLSRMQRYLDATHEDFARFQGLSKVAGLPARMRAAVFFALGKAWDDIGAYSQAVLALRQANELLRAEEFWSRHRWRRQVEAQLRTPIPPADVDPFPDFTPVLVVGMPRSGTTLVAERLGRDARLRVRGELGCLPYLARQFAECSEPWHASQLRAAARFYHAQLRQDDAPAGWYLDKNPLNFRYLGLAAALFPNLRVIWCRRAPRDTAISIWSHFFSHPDNGYARDFEHIATVTRDCERLMSHWQDRVHVPIYVVDYERMVAEPQRMIAQVRDFLGLGAAVSEAQAPAARPAIVTASFWQARQPVYRHAVERWRHYAPHLPELLRAFPV